MAKTHWKKLTNPDYLGAYSLDDGRDIVATIDHVVQEKVTGADGKSEECVVCYFKGGVKKMILNATNLKTITKLLGTPFIEDWAGRKIQIGIEKVKAFGEVVEALRVRKTAPKSVEIRCEACQSVITPANGMTPEQLAAYTKKKYGASICAECAKKAAERAKAEKAAEKPVERPVTNEAVKVDETNG